MGWEWREKGGGEGVGVEGEVGLRGWEWRERGGGEGVGVEGERWG